MWHYLTDPHLGHKNIIKYSNRPFRNEYEMDETILHDINKIVQPKDVLVIGGDFMMPRLENKNSIEEYNERFLAYVRQINCKQLLFVGGNHDRYLVQSHGDYIPNFKLWDALRWQGVCECGRVFNFRQKACHKNEGYRPLDAVHPMGFELMLTDKLCAEHGIDRKFSGIIVLFCHYSMRVWNKSHRDRDDGYGRSIMLYGHSHGELPGIHNSFDCGWDVFRRPVSLQEVFEKLIPEHNDKFGERFAHHPGRKN